MTEALSVLKELVACKDLKESAEALHFAGPLSSYGEDWRAEYDRMRAEYIKRQPVAWDRARALLAQEPPSTEPAPSPAAVSMQPLALDYDALWEEAMRRSLASHGSVKREYALAVLAAANSWHPAAFQLTHSIIHNCPALKLPQGWIEKLGNVAQIIALKGADEALAQSLVDRLNAPPQAAAPAPQPMKPVNSTELCPNCGTEEWDHVTAERGRERDVPFNRCNRCNNEWSAP